MNNDDIKAIASEVAKTLFTDGDGDVAKRLVLDMGDGRDGGGWCRASVEREVREVIRRHLTAVKKESEMTRSIKFVVKTDNVSNRWLFHRGRKTMCLSGFWRYFRVPGWAKTVELILRDRPAKGRLKVEFRSYDGVFSIVAKNTSGLEERFGLTEYLNSLIQRMQLGGKTFYVECYYTE